MPNYPAQIDTSQSLPTVVDGQTPVRGSIFNKLRDAVIAIESELGTKPSSIYSTVKNRLETIETSISTILAINLNGDVIGSFDDTQVVSLYGKPLSTVTPLVDQILGWDGISWSPVFPNYAGVVGGDLTGFLPNPLVSGLFGYPIENTSPNLQDVLTWNGSVWTPSQTQTPEIGNGLFVTDNTVNVGVNADQTILANTDDIQLNPDFYSTSAINGTLVQRDLNFGFIEVADSAGSARYGAGIFLTEDSIFTVRQSQKSSDNLTHDMSIITQMPHSFATGSRRLPGNLIIDVPAAAGALASTTSGNVSLRFGGVEYIRLESNLNIPAGNMIFPANGQINTTGNLQVISSGASSISTGTDFTLFATNDINTTAGNLISFGSSGNASIVAINDTTISAGDTLELEGTNFLTLSGDVISLTGDISATISVPDFVVTTDNIFLNTNEAIIGESFDLTISQAAQTSDIDCNNITIVSQSPFATATGANRVPGDINLTIGTPTNGGTTNGSFNFGIGAYPAVMSVTLDSGSIAQVTFPVTDTNIESTYNLTLTGQTLSLNSTSNDMVLTASGVQMIAPVLAFYGDQFYNGTGTANLIMETSSSGTVAGTGFVTTLAGQSMVGAGATVGGDLTLRGGTGNKHGNIGLGAAPNFGGNAAKCVFIADATGIPSVAPTNGIGIWAESGNFKIVSAAANVVTLGDKPTVTGSKVSGAALVSLLSILQAAGIITDGTSA